MLNGLGISHSGLGSELLHGGSQPPPFLVRQVLGAIAQFEKASIVEKLAAARKAASLWPLLGSEDNGGQGLVA